MKLWEKGIKVDKLIEQFTVGNDRELDKYLAPYDVLGSIAHAIMLSECGLLSKEEAGTLAIELSKIYKETSEEGFCIAPQFEDIHSHVEFLLTSRLGDAGKKIHTARSRNDQVLLDIRMYFRDVIAETRDLSKSLFDLLIDLSNRNKDILIPGYTHFQAAMPSSFGLFFGAYAESLADDILCLNNAFSIINQNPLGSAAGYGSSFPIDRTITTRLLGFDDLNYNSIYAQMGRGKAEKVLAFALSCVGSTLNKLASDVCLYMSQNFNFLRFPDELTTGSSIMPHKKNPDVFELIRAKTNKVAGVLGQLQVMTSNLPHGYHRDFQLLKETVFPAINEIQSSLFLTKYMLENVQVSQDVIQDEKYKYIFSVDEINALVNKGVPFREAYQEIGKQIMEGTFAPSAKLNHTHQGSTGNLCNEEIVAKMNRFFEAIDTGTYKKTCEALLCK